MRGALSLLNTPFGVQDLSETGFLRRGLGDRSGPADSHSFHCLCRVIRSIFDVVQMVVGTVTRDQAAFATSSIILQVEGGPGRPAPVPTKCAVTRRTPPTRSASCCGRGDPGGDPAARRPDRPPPTPGFDAADCRGRNVVERSFQRAKQWRGIATRYDKHNSTTAVELSSTPFFLWLKRLWNTP